MNMSGGGIGHGDLGRTYRITPIQQPERSAPFRQAYLSRLPLSPALILQLDCWDAQGELIIPHDELPFLVVHLTLQTPSGDDATMLISPEPPDTGQVISMLYGTLVTSPTEMIDQAGGRGIYFCFPDVSCRYGGRWKLLASLLRVTGGPPLNTCETDEFDIVPDGMAYVAPPITDLTRHFDAQGLVNFGLPKSEW